MGLAMGSVTGQDTPKKDTLSSTIVDRIRNLKDTALQTRNKVREAVDGLIGERPIEVATKDDKIDRSGDLNRIDDVISDILLLLVDINSEIDSL